MARIRNKPAPPPVPGDAGAEVTDEPSRVISRAAAIDVAKGSGMVCLRLPHESRAGRRTQKVWEVAATFAAVVALMDHVVCQGVERLVVGVHQRLLAYLAAPRGALLYSRLSWEEFGGYSWVRWLTQDPKGEGDNSMPGN